MPRAPPKFDFLRDLSAASVCAVVPENSDEDVTDRPAGSDSRRFKLPLWQAHPSLYVRAVGWNQLLARNVPDLPQVDLFLIRALPPVPAAQIIGAEDANPDDGGALLARTEEVDAECFENMRFMAENGHAVVLDLGAVLSSASAGQNDMAQAGIALARCMRGLRQLTRRESWVVEPLDDGAHANSSPPSFFKLTETGTALAAGPPHVLPARVSANLICVSNVAVDDAIYVDAAQGSASGDSDSCGAAMVDCDGAGFVAYVGDRAATLWPKFVATAALLAREKRRVNAGAQGQQQREAQAPVRAQAQPVVRPKAVDPSMGQQVDLAADFGTAGASSSQGGQPDLPQQTLFMPPDLGDPDDQPESAATGGSADVDLYGDL